MPLNYKKEENAMNQILLDIPDDSLFALRVSADEVGAELRMAAGVKLLNREVVLGRPRSRRHSKASVHVPAWRLWRLSVLSG